jgi:hypothetical protein
LGLGAGEWSPLRAVMTDFHHQRTNSTLL